MPVSMSQASLPVFEIGLNALSAVLDKAAAHAAAKKIDQSVLAGWRLAPDMFALARQVQVACDQAKNGSARLAGTEPPKFEDTETTVDQLKERIAKTVAYLKTLDTKAIEQYAGPGKMLTSSCQTSISISPPPMRRCGILAWTLASGTFSAQSRSREFNASAQTNGPWHHTPGPLPSQIRKKYYFRRLAAS